MPTPRKITQKLQKFTQVLLVVLVTFRMYASVQLTSLHHKPEEPSTLADMQIRCQGEFPAIPYTAVIVMENSK